MLWILLLFLCVFAWVLYTQRKVRIYDAVGYQRRASVYRAREFVLTHAMKNGVSRIEFEDSIWPVRALQKGLSMPMGTWVKVVKTDGVILLVEPIPHTAE